MTHSYFITGTDTDVGKTLVATALIHAFQQHGRRVAGFKPVSAGCDNTPLGLRNDDAVQLQTLSSIDLPYDLVNPYAFEAPVAPHIAASEQGIQMSLEKIAQCHKEISEQVDIVIIEGAGGWQVPLNHVQSMADVARTIADEIILVAGMKLGCLNHALLTARSIADNGLTLAGWIANSTGPRMPYYDQNIETLATRLQATLLGEIDFLNPVSTNAVAACLNLEKLNI